MKERRKISLPRVSITETQIRMKEHVDEISIYIAKKKIEWVL